VLRSFRVANHRSIRDEQELLLLPAYHDNEPAVPVAAVYGANASGKSNLLDALNFMAAAVRDSFGRWSPNGGVPRRPFKLHPTAMEQPSVFVADMVIDDVRYTYGFAVDDHVVLDEWLYSYPEKRKRILFERARSVVKVGSTVPEMRAKMEILEQLLRPNALFLSLAAQSNLAQVAPVYGFFEEKIKFRSGVSNGQDLDRVVTLLGAPEGQTRLVELVRLADVGVVDVLVAFDAAANERLLAARLRADELRNQIEQLRSHKNSEPSADGEKFDVRMGELERAFLAVDTEAITLQYMASRSDRRIRFVHAGAADGFAFDEESAGTQSWIRVLPTVLQALDDGRTLVVDEIDTSLHPKLTAQLVRLFQDPETNPNRAQLIFTTHDTSLLGTMLGDEVLKRDQVWFVEKDDEGASKLYPLTDFHPRKGENAERRYLGGSYGAVPVLSERDFAEAVRVRRAT
jgi:hypothetical protein